jgi:hypothetical protein
MAMDQKPRCPWLVLMDGYLQAIRENRVLGMGSLVLEYMLPKSIYVPSKMMFDPMILIHLPFWDDIVCIHQLN